MRFSAMLLFSILWLFIVYLPMAHMVWGKGGLPERVSRRHHSLLRFRRRYSRPYNVGVLGAWRALFIWVSASASEAKA